MEFDCYNHVLLIILCLAMYQLESLIEQSKELPPLPEIYIRVSELLESDTANAQEVGEAVQTDPSLTARVLKMINSAYYGLPHQVTSISQAISLLGRQQIKHILMGSVLAGVFKDINIEGFPLQEFWEHSIKTAIIARHLAMQNIHVIDHEAFFTAGLLHDIGRLVIAQVAADKLAEIDQLVAVSGVDIVETESDKLGVTHVEVGAALMRKWNMPSLLTQCVVKHHDTVHLGPFALDTSIVYLANQLSHHELVETEEEMQAILSGIQNWQDTDCTAEQIEIACHLADNQWMDVLESLGMAEDVFINFND